MARTILVADDSPTITRKVEGILKGEGFDVKSVSNGVAAIKKIPQVKPLVVLADVSMPGKDGYEVCEFVKNSAELAHVPVVLIFSAMEEYNEQRAAQVRADGRIEKKTSGTPFDSEELISTVAKFVAQSEAGAPKPAPTVIAAQPSAPAFVLEPVDEEPVIAPKQETPDFSALSEGIAFAEPALEEVPVAPSEPPPPASEPMMEAEISPEPEPSVSSEAATVSAAEPVLVEEPAAAPAPPAPAAERTMLFRAPADIAEPVLTDEVVSAPPPDSGSQGTAVTATSLDNFSLTEATTGQVRIAPPETGAAPAPETASALDKNQIYSIVLMVVTRMSPPALSPQMIQEMARKLADEITADL